MLKKETEIIKYKYKSDGESGKELMWDGTALPSLFYADDPNQPDKSKIITNSKEKNIAPLFLNKGVNGK